MKAILAFYRDRMLNVRAKLILTKDEVEARDELVKTHARLLKWIDLDTEDHSYRILCLIHAVANCKGPNSNSSLFATEIEKLLVISFQLGKESAL